MTPRLHLIGIFHTRSTPEYSHCAFTGKAMRFPRMMQAQGFEVIEYSNYGSAAGATEHVEMLDETTYQRLYGAREATAFYGDLAVVGSEGHRLFEQQLVRELEQRLGVGDIVCHPFGHAHEGLLERFPQALHVETGIGYPTLMKGSFRIFESYAWMHYHQGREGRNGHSYEWVVPNYFDLNDWDVSYEKGEYLAFLGRICQIKGMDTIRAIADHSKWPIVLHGQGDPSDWNHPNIEYRGPIHGKARSNFLRGARAALMPSVFTEPFAGSGVEAMLCGTPLISVDYGAFTETVVPEVTGFRCHTLQDWLDAIERVDELSRRTVAYVTRKRYSLEGCGIKYSDIFHKLHDLYRNGWYELRKPR